MENTVFVKEAVKTTQFIGKCGIPVERLRLTLTSRCMFKCFFCHGEGLETTRLPELTVKQIETLVKEAANFGIRIVKLVGGEALIRDDLERIVSAVARHVDDRRTA